MSEENVEIVRGFYEMINRGGAASLLQLADAERRRLFDQLFDPDIEIRQSPQILDTAGSFRGYNGLIAAAREIDEALDDIQYELGHGRANENFVVFEVQALGTGRASGITIGIPVAHLWELREGRICQWGVYPSLEEALQAAGLSE